MEGHQTDGACMKKQKRFQFALESIPKSSAAFLILLILLTLIVYDVSPVIRLRLLRPRVREIVKAGRPWNEAESDLRSIGLTATGSGRHYMATVRTPIIYIGLSRFAVWSGNQRLIDLVAELPRRGMLITLDHSGAVERVMW